VFNQILKSDAKIRRAEADGVKIAAEETTSQSVKPYAAKIAEVVTGVVVGQVLDTLASSAGADPDTYREMFRGTVENSLASAAGGLASYVVETFGE